MADTFVSKSVARIGDMHPRRVLRVRRMKDNDIIVSIEEDGMPIGGPIEPNATVEFCSLAGGGGRSRRGGGDGAVRGPARASLGRN